jgi:uncharacterized protein YdcH (DUF465 family)
MDFLQPEVRDRLAKENLEFSKLIKEHKVADDRLAYLSNKVQLSAKESVEEVELKKAKLRAKERIYSIVEEFKSKASKQ